MGISSLVRASNQRQLSKKGSFVMFDLIGGEQKSAYPSRTKPVLATLAALALPLVLLIAAGGASAFAADYKAAAGTPSVIVFSPGAVMLNNPTIPATAAGVPTTITVNVTAYDAQGNVLEPTPSNPLYLQVYGAPEGVITPTTVQLTSGTAVQFTYSGAFFPHNMELAAWIKDPLAGDSLGTTLFVQQNRPPCTGTASFSLNTTSTVPNPIRVKAVVGADNPQPSNFKNFTIDTGSLGVIVTKESLVMGSNVHGPGAAGQKFYDSSGYVFTGNYYLAPVSVQLGDQSFVQTSPILILAIDAVHCHPGYPKCVTPSKPDLHYLGVGFDRNSTGPGDLFNSPSENAFLQLTDSQNGTDINEGYILSTQGVTAGLTAENSSGFNTYQLSPNTVAGDWNPVPGCFQFTTLSGNPQFCGNLLLDVGISEMFLDLSFGSRPAGSYDSNNEVPDGVGMNILAGTTGQPAMNYNFTAVQPPEQPMGSGPTYAKWINVQSVFVNTGRRPLLSFDYLYSGQCGEVGFRPLTGR